MKFLKIYDPPTPPVITEKFFNFPLQKLNPILIFTGTVVVNTFSSVHDILVESSVTAITDCVDNKEMEETTPNVEYNIKLKDDDGMLPYNNVDKHGRFHRSNNNIADTNYFIWFTTKSNTDDLESNRGNEHESKSFNERMY